MDVRPLVDVDLREALGPINRSQAGQGGQFVPAMRTAALLRERAGCGLLDLKLSHACYIGGSLVGSCLVERDGERSHIDALGVEPLAQQRGAGRALIEAVCSTAKAAGVARIGTYAAELDSQLLAILQAVGFAEQQSIGRYTLSGAPAPLPQPPESSDPAAASQLDEPSVRPSDLATVLPLLLRDRSLPLLFGQLPTVLTKLSAKLSLFALFSPTAATPLAVAVGERERRLLHAIGGPPDSLAPLLCLLGARYGLACLDALGDGDPAEPALLLAGFVRVARRSLWAKDLG